MFKENICLFHIGAELFAKRRKRSEKWIVDETSRSANNPAATSYSAGPAQIYDTNQFNQANQTNQYNQSNYIDQVSDLTINLRKIQIILN